MREQIEVLETLVRFSRPFALEELIAWEKNCREIATGDLQNVLAAMREGKAPHISPSGWRKVAQLIEEKQGRSIGRPKGSPNKRRDYALYLAFIKRKARYGEEKKAIERLVEILERKGLNLDYQSVRSAKNNGEKIQKELELQLVKQWSEIAYLCTDLSKNRM